MAFRQNYNGCKTFGCANCGNPDEALYRYSDRLGYPAWHCELCGAYPPVLLNPPILALAREIEQRRYLSDFPLHCHCQNHTRSKWQRYGRTHIGSQRLQCTNCQTVVSQANSDLTAKRLQPWLDALAQGITPSALQSHLGLSNKVFAQHIAQLCELLNHYSHYIEQYALTRTTEHTLYTFSHIQSCRSGMKASSHKQQYAQLWTLCTLDINSGYVYLLSDNTLSEMNANLTDDSISWRHDSQYVLKVRENSIEGEADVLLRAEKTYQKILSRSQFDQLAYCDEKHAFLKLGQEPHNALMRPVYAAHAHMQNLKQHLTFPAKTHWLLEHESFLRGAAITAYSADIEQGVLALYYYHYSLDQPNTEHSTQYRTLSWWNEKWHKLCVVDKDEQHQVGLGVLTPTSEISVMDLQALLPKTIDWDKQFWQAFECWLPCVYAQKLSQPRVEQWQTIYRYIHNYLSTKKPRIAIPAHHSVDSIAAMVKRLNQQDLVQNKRG
ncbi:hypothetical protein VSVS12_02611 [Vibrio scophthalmi]|uniref:hypothetical protein n=1 Tax=Vibrio scophthalmi TaxID=45658 RepID=UPI00080956E4|nr:hypothetical protein [Vibrio scophthalmi]ANS86367.1 hypothetical protein VSVS12_02611 [Vibrio scophthalmi]